ncbi:hypothetical protein PCE1_003520 [Barthelona sp. PCE]
MSIRSTLVRLNTLFKDHGVNYTPYDIKESVAAFKGLKSQDDQSPSVEDGLSAVKPAELSAYIKNNTIFFLSSTENAQLFLQNLRFCLIDLFKYAMVQLDVKDAMFIRYFYTLAYIGQQCPIFLKHFENQLTSSFNLLTLQFPQRESDEQHLLLAALFLFWVAGVNLIPNNPQRVFSMMSEAKNDEIRCVFMRIVHVISDLAESKSDSIMTEIFDFELVEITKARLSRILKTQTDFIVQEFPLPDDEVRRISLHTVSLFGIPFPHFGSYSFNDIIFSENTRDSIRQMALSILEKKAVILSGPPGSGRHTLFDFFVRLTESKQTIVHISDGGDLKDMLGMHIISEDSSFTYVESEFVRAVKDGSMVIIENLDKASDEIFALLDPLLANRKLLNSVKGEVIEAHADFRLFATCTSSLFGEIQTSHRDDWNLVSVSKLAPHDLKQIVFQRYSSSLSQPVCELLVGAYHELLDKQELQKMRNSNFRISHVVDFFLFLDRLKAALIKDRDMQIDSYDFQKTAFLIAVDVFLCHISDSEVFEQFLDVLCLALKVDVSVLECSELKSIDWFERNNNIHIGRTISEVKGELDEDIALTDSAKITLERLSFCVKENTPALLVGETGEGKTTLVQYLSGIHNTHLNVINCSFQSDSSTFIGGFKPRSIENEMVALVEQFKLTLDEGSLICSQANVEGCDELFQFSLSQLKSDIPLKQKLAVIDQTCIILNEVFSMHIEGNTTTPQHLLAVVRTMASKFNTHLASSSKLRSDSANSALHFGFVEGLLLEAIKKGEWVLLDEINLSTTETLNRLIEFIDTDCQAVSVWEAGSLEKIPKHPNFRVFACMNPPTDVGKRALSDSVRYLFNEIYVPRLIQQDSLELLAQALLRTVNISNNICRKCALFYIECHKLATEGSLFTTDGLPPTFSIRTLSRALRHCSKLAGVYGKYRALHDGIQMTFFGTLNDESRRLLYASLGSIVFNTSELRNAIKTPPNVTQAHRVFNTAATIVERCAIPLGELPVKEDSSLKFIRTATVRRNLTKVAMAIGNSSYPILLEGPTSAGKTSLITYIAALTGHTLLRINNHEHTDIQEYLGYYTSDAEGCLVWKDGLLVQALKNGWWIILDELNLAPTDVLEALNRLLDDNRELFIPETNEIVRPKSSFLLFATQNPSGIYGGRKTLSRALRGRFIEIHVPELPAVELKTIIEKRCVIAPSWAELLLNVLLELEIQRSTGSLFMGRHGFITLRDLFRWADRAKHTATTRVELMIDGYLLLAERLRTDKEKDVIYAALCKVFSKEFDRDLLYLPQSYTSERVLSKHLEDIEDTLSAFNETIPPSRQMILTATLSRLYELINRAINNNESVLLVGPTGLGKTSVVQLYASLKKQAVHILNCHKHTESADFLGSLKPRRVASEVYDRIDTLAVEYGIKRGSESMVDFVHHLITCSEDAEDDKTGELHELLQEVNAFFVWENGPLTNSMINGEIFLIDEISLADDSVLERLNPVLERERVLVLPEAVTTDNSDGVIKCHDKFGLVATMNPGGDFGKRELSPALRNRFTEIWVSEITTEEEFRLFAKHRMRFLKEYQQAATDILVCAMMTFKRVSPDAVTSLRDILGMANGVLTWMQTLEFDLSYKSYDERLCVCILHAIYMVLLDGISVRMGLDAQTGREIAKTTINAIKDEIEKIEECELKEPFIAALERKTSITLDGYKFGTEPFLFSCRPNRNGLKSFTLNCPTVQHNLVGLLRALSLNAPILLEGSPGVGKTSLVMTIASVMRKRITRLNLSSETDLMDLLGSFYPTVRDGHQCYDFIEGPLLQAVRNGHWVILDELNLASQTVLEGINSLLDHRQSLYIVELDKVVTAKQGFQLFATQNPLHEGGGRKGLPKSFVNRFTTVYVNPLRSADLTRIAMNMYPTVSIDLIGLVLDIVYAFNEEVCQKQSFGVVGGPWEFNLRDLKRVMSVARTISPDCDLSLQIIIEACCAVIPLRFRSVDDQRSAFELIKYVATDYWCKIPSDDIFSLYRLSYDDNRMQIGSLASPAASSFLKILPIRSMLPHMHSIMAAVTINRPVVVSGTNPAVKLSVLRQIANSFGRELVLFNGSSSIDANDLLGAFEQFDLAPVIADVITTMSSIQKALSRKITPDNERYTTCFAILDSCMSKLSALVAMHGKGQKEAFAHKRSAIGIISRAVTILVDHASDLSEIDSTIEAKVTFLERMLKMMTENEPRPGVFVWKDGVITRAAAEGQWVVFLNAGLCSSAVLDRLNGLLETDGELILSECGLEDGVVRTITPHTEFRVFFDLGLGQGELSRALRNRSIETFVDDNLHTFDTFEIQQTIGISTERDESDLRNIAENALLASTGSLSSETVEVGKFAAEVKAPLFKSQFNSHTNSVMELLLRNENLSTYVLKQTVANLPEEFVEFVLTDEHSSETLNVIEFVFGWLMYNNITPVHAFNLLVKLIGVRKQEHQDINTDDVIRRMVKIYHHFVSKLERVLPSRITQPLYNKPTYLQLVTPEMEHCANHFPTPNVTLDLPKSQIDRMLIFLQLMSGDVSHYSDLLGEDENNVVLRSVLSLTPFVSSTHVTEFNRALPLTFNAVNDSINSLIGSVYNSSLNNIGMLEKALSTCQRASTSGFNLQLTINHLIDVCVSLLGLETRNIASEGGVNTAVKYLQQLSHMAVDPMSAEVSKEYCIFSFKSLKAVQHLVNYANDVVRGFDVFGFKLQFERAEESIGIALSCLETAQNAKARVGGEESDFYQLMEVIHDFAFNTLNINRITAIFGKSTTDTIKQLLIIESACGNIIRRLKRMGLLERKRIGATVSVSLLLVQMYCLKRALHLKQSSSTAIDEKTSNASLVAAMFLYSKKSMTASEMYEMLTVRCRAMILEKERRDKEAMEGEKLIHVASNLIEEEDDFIKDYVDQFNAMLNVDEDGEMVGEESAPSNFVDVLSDECKLTDVLASALTFISNVTEEGFDTGVHVINGLISLNKESLNLVPALVETLTSRLLHSKGLTDPDFNIFDNPHPKEISRLVPLVQAVIDQCSTLLADPMFEEHTVLSVIMRACDRVMGLRLCEPLSYFTAAVETILNVCEEWNALAPREYKFTECIKPLEMFVVHVRKSEIEQWPYLFASARKHCEARAAEMFPFIFNSLVSQVVDLQATSMIFEEEFSVMVEGICGDLEDFIKSSTIGCFSHRLTIIDFCMEFLSQIMHTLSTDCRPIIEAYIKRTRGLITMYRVFERHVKEKHDSLMDTTGVKEKIAELQSLARIKKSKGSEDVIEDMDTGYKTHYMFKQATGKFRAKLSKINAQYIRIVNIHVMTHIDEFRSIFARVPMDYAHVEIFGVTGLVKSMHAAMADLDAKFASDVTRKCATHFSNYIIGWATQYNEVRNGLSGLLGSYAPKIAVAFEGEHPFDRQQLTYSLMKDLRGLGVAGRPNEIKLVNGFTSLYEVSNIASDMPPAFSRALQATYKIEMQRNETHETCPITVFDHLLLVIKQLLLSAAQLRRGESSVADRFDAMLGLLNHKEETLVGLDIMPELAEKAANYNVGLHFLKPIAEFEAISTDERQVVASLKPATIPFDKETALHQSDRVMCASHLPTLADEDAATTLGGLGFTEFGTNFTDFLTLLNEIRYDPNAPTASLSEYVDEFEAFMRKMIEAMHALSKTETLCTFIIEEEDGLQLSLPQFMKHIVALQHVFYSSKVVKYVCSVNFADGEDYVFIDGDFHLRELVRVLQKMARFIDTLTTQASTAMIDVSQFVISVLHLLHREGFGETVEYQESEETDKYDENEGPGLGEGEGGEKDVSDEIEEDWQMEGLENEDNSLKTENDGSGFDAQSDFEGEQEDLTEEQQEEMDEMNMDELDVEDELGEAQGEEDIEEELWDNDIEQNSLPEDFDNDVKGEGEFDFDNNEEENMEEVEEDAVDYQQPEMRDAEEEEGEEHEEEDLDNEKEDHEKEDVNNTFADAMSDVEEPEEPHMEEVPPEDDEGPEEMEEPDLEDVAIDEIEDEEIEEGEGEEDQDENAEEMPTIDEGLAEDENQEDEENREEEMEECDEDQQGTFGEEGAGTTEGSGESAENEGSAQGAGQSDETLQRSRQEKTEAQEEDEVVENAFERNNEGAAEDAEDREYAEEEDETKEAAVGVGSSEQQYDEMQDMEMQTVESEDEVEHDEAEERTNKAQAAPTVTDVEQNEDRPKEEEDDEAMVAIKPIERIKTFVGSNVVDLDFSQAKLAQQELIVNAAMRQVMSNDVDDAISFTQLQREIAPLASRLTEQLRLILLPTQTSQLKGDYKTGKRINIRKVIAYIASNFRKDAIWLRRTKPQKRQYDIVLAMDNSLSMADLDVASMGLQTTAVIAQALTNLDSGNVGVLRFGETAEFVHSLGEPFTSHGLKRLIGSFNFDEEKTSFADMFRVALSELSGRAHANRVSNPDVVTNQLLFCISDGRINDMERIKKWAAFARASNILVALIIIDPPDTPTPITEFMQIKFETRNGKTKPVKVPYLTTIPLDFYVVVNDMRELPGVVSQALQQWISLLAR